MANNFQGAHDFQVDKLKINVTNISSSSSGVGLKELESRIAAGAMHDSAERCDAPKCHPDTRVAVQDDLYDWIMDGEGDSEHPKKIKWVTGPAGTGKTAVMGSLSERCKAGGVLAATFFFASWSASIGRRRKTSFVTTIAHQLARYHPDLREEISKAIEANSDIFDKNLHTQMKILVLVPLQEIARRPDAPGFQGVIIIDGLDECEAEQYHDTTTAGSKSKLLAPRTNDQDQLEILEVLQAASSDPSFPFHILVASRPERVFREFFSPTNSPDPFAQKLDLHEDYNADFDIALFLGVKFQRLGRRHNLPQSWPPPEVIRILVENASGQFIYAATVIRFLDTGHREPLQALLKAVLKMEANTTSNPLEHLDALYGHILESSPDPPYSVRWIYAIDLLSLFKGTSAFNVNMLLQRDAESNEAEHLLGNLHSLIQIPPPGGQESTKYRFYHKSLLDFLEDPSRSRGLYVENKEVKAFIWDQFIRVCASEFDFASVFVVPSLTP
ncbi:hypothetical protein EST38_g7012 [Candolleomyces aberdarensis]|uniref:Nephrocystin 3-like N-terminal domain-containing protein n=1 Tax=Candolleomyces aberdarensis TaxID=2316362 RepID=A0A4Q2DIH8_9AGAR|nr:hypothetical protein EST38_g7012 [Candolleomyces aberdarensis]